MNQCTGEPIAISLRGTIVARQSVEGAGYRYVIQSRLNGSASDQSGTRYPLVGEENAEFGSESAETVIILFNNVRVPSAAGEPTYVGYDEQTIIINANGEIENVEHRFEFACD